MRSRFMTSSPSAEDDVDRDHDGRDDQEQDHVAGGGQAVEAGLVLLVDHRADDVAGNPGPPLVMAQISSNERSPPISDSRITVAVAGMTSGMVMCQKFCHLLAPSTRAAS